MNTLGIITLTYCFIASICTAQTVSMSVAAFSVPEDSTGAVYIRTGENKSKPLQLSKNHFSTPVLVAATKLELYQQPFNPADDKQKPLVTINLPPGSKSYKVLVWSILEKNQDAKWSGRAFASDRWPEACMILANFTEKTIVFESTNTRKVFSSGRTIIFTGKKEKNGSPVKLYARDPEDPASTRLIFSSVWRVPEKEQELILIYASPNTSRIMTHSYIPKKQVPTNQP